MIDKMTYVQIYKSILSEDKRSSNLPHDTKRVPLEMRVKGKLLEPAEIGDVVKIKTITGRVETGILIVAEPHFSHSFGHHVQVLNDVRDIILKETEDL
ncbi:MAG: 2-amino-4-oxopentanoate thiolase subunit OrtA [Tenericutes bacterium]|nr:2-amino-4-oxopentanoate thiolase subunit OrtA [Mycoplasmatota bacterium]